MPFPEGSNKDLFSKRKDPYQVLGLEQGATADDVKKAFRKLALENRPDKNVTKSPEEQEAANVRFKDINEANDILKNPSERSTYDSSKAFYEAARNPQPTPDQPKPSGPTSENPRRSASEGPMPQAPTSEGPQTSSPSTEDTTVAVVSDAVALVDDNARQPKQANAEPKKKDPTPTPEPEPKPEAAPEAPKKTAKKEEKKENNEEDAFQGAMKAAIDAVKDDWLKSMLQFILQMQKALANTKEGIIGLAKGNENEAEAAPDKPAPKKPSEREHEETDDKELDEDEDLDADEPLQLEGGQEPLQLEGGEQPLQLEGDDQPLMLMPPDNPEPIPSPQSVASLSQTDTTPTTTTTPDVSPSLENDTTPRLGR